MSEKKQKKEGIVGSEREIEYTRPSARCSAAKVNERVFSLSRLVLRTNGGG